MLGKYIQHLVIRYFDIFFKITCNKNRLFFCIIKRSKL